MDTGLYASGGVRAAPRLLPVPVSVYVDVHVVGASGKHWQLEECGRKSVLRCLCLRNTVHAGVRHLDTCVCGRDNDIGIGARSIKTLRPRRPPVLRAEETRRGTATIAICGCLGGTRRCFCFSLGACRSVADLRCLYVCSRCVGFFPLEELVTTGGARRLALMPACVHNGAAETAAATGQTWEAYLQRRRRRKSGFASGVVIACKQDQGCYDATGGSTRGGSLRGQVKLISRSLYWMGSTETRGHRRWRGR